MSARSHARFRPLSQQSRAQVAWLVASMGCISFSPFAMAQNREGRAGDAAANIAEVIVTAQKREEHLQDVPISLSVVRSQQLDSSTFESLNDIITQTPGIYSYESGQTGGTKFSIRGVTSNPSLVSGSSTLAYYLDNVPFAFARFPLTPDANAYDLQRVEVLRGPQGTLYGASTLNGVVRIVTQDANLNELQFKSRASTSNTEGGGWNYRGDLALSVPIVEGKLAARAVVGYQDFSGWIDQPLIGKEDANDSQVKMARFKVNAKPSEQLGVELEAWVSREDRGGRSVANDAGINNNISPEPESFDYDLYEAKIDYQSSSVSLTSATSYIDYENVAVNNVGTFVVTTLGSKLFAEEIRLASNYEGAWQWFIGGMYRDAEDRAISDLPVVFPGLTADRIYGSESFAAFGELKYSFADGKFDVTGGLRYFEDDTSADEVSRLGISGNPPSPQLPLTHRSTTFDSVTPRVVFSWHPSKDLHVYTSYAEGFRSGFELDGTTLAAAPNTPPVKADTLNNYELGAKGNLFGGRLSYDVAVYYVDWKDSQQVLFVPGPVANTFVGVQANGEDLTGPGFDMALSTTLADRLSLALRASVNDLGFKENVVHPNGTLLFLKGDRPDESPKTTLGASLDYSIPVGSAGFETEFSAGVNYSSKTTSHSGAVVGFGDSFTNVDVRLSLLAPKNWTATLFADNLTNADPRIRAAVIPPTATFAPYSRVRPRTIGLQFEYNY